MSLATFIQASAHSLPMLADGSVQMIATSPPYYGLRSYAGEQGVEWPAVTFRLNEWVEPTTVPGCDPNCEHEWVNAVDLAEGVLGHSIPQKRAGNDYCARCGGWRGGLGMEPSPVAYLAHLILCLREWRRVLRDDGVVFCNLGDSYANDTKWGGRSSGKNYTSALGGYNGQNTRRQTGVKPKDLLMIPAMFAIAARADGWYLRSDICWVKPNPMPESVTDRPTKAHEYIFLLAKSARYFWDADAVREPGQEWAGSAGTFNRANGKATELQVPGQARVSHRERDDRVPAGRNLRTVWNVSTSPFPGAHFACWPEKLVEPMVKAGTSERGACPHCGKPWERVTERPTPPHVAPSEIDRFGTGDAGVHRKVGQKYQDWLAANPTQTTGWQPGCTCSPHEPVPCVVCDPFSGSGTTAKVAVRLGRRAIGVDVSAEYLEDVTAQRFGAGVQMELV